MTRPATELLLADELFLMLHDQSSGRPRTHPRVAGLGLAAGLLGELMLDGSVTVASGLLVVVDGRPSPDALAHDVLGQLVGAPRQRTVRIWLDLLAQDALHEVGQRMVRTGRATRTENRRLWRTFPEYRSVDPEAPRLCESRLRELLDGHAARTVSDATLLSLVAAVGLAPHLHLDVDAGELPAPLHELVVHTATAVAEVPERAAGPKRVAGPKRADATKGADIAQRADATKRVDVCERVDKRTRAGAGQRASG
ncbi:GPP34 family phosphoprotein [Actinomycetes bacterium KLBMP 9797]